MKFNEIIGEAIRLVDENVSVTLPVNGWSMLPFIIGGKESVILQKPTELKEGEVVLAWTTDNHYVIHRIIRINGEKVELMGDGNLRGREYCARSDVKALVTHVVDADEHVHYIYTWWRRLSARLWFWLRPIRRYLLAIYKRMKKYED